jgi:hypothetical protein
MAKKASEINPVAIYNGDRYIVAKKLMLPLDGNETVI